METDVILEKGISYGSSCQIPSASKWRKITFVFNTFSILPIQYSHSFSSKLSCSITMFLSNLSNDRNALCQSSRLISGAEIPSRTLSALNISTLLSSFNSSFFMSLNLRIENPLIMKSSSFAVRGKMILPPHGKEFFHAAVSSFLHPSVRTFLHYPVSSFFTGR